MGNSSNPRFMESDYSPGEDNPVKLLIQVKVTVVISVNSLVLNHGKKENIKSYV